MIWTPLNETHIIYTLRDGSLSSAIQCPEKNIWLGKCRVMFGFRLVGASLDNKVGPDINICCGPLTEPFNSLFAKVIDIINVNPHSNPFLGIPPQSIIKPYYEDLDFCCYIDELHSNILQKAS